MRFDAARALDEAQNFALDRLPWTEGGRRAVDRVEEAFREAGYVVERTEVSGNPSARNSRIVLTYLLSSALAAVGPVALEGSARGLVFLFAWMLVLFGVSRIPWLVETLFLQGPTVRTWNVNAERPEEADRIGRVVIVTTLDVAPPVSTSVLREPVRFAYWVFLIGVLILSGLPIAWPKGAICALLATLGILTSAAIVCLVRPFPGERGSDNADGLGFLVEFARAWTHARESRIEVRFVACGGEILDRAGLRRLGMDLRDRWPARPTLVIGLWSPGRASTLTIADPSGTPFASETANDLWIPWRAEDGELFGSQLLFFGPQMATSAFVGLIGTPTADEPTILDEEALRRRTQFVQRTAQLVHELMLRWAKLVTLQASGDTAAPSSLSS